MTNTISIYIPGLDHNASSVIQEYLNPRAVASTMASVCSQWSTVAKSTRGALESSIESLFREDYVQVFKDCKSSIARFPKMNSIEYPLWSLPWFMGLICLRPTDMPASVVRFQNRTGTEVGIGLHLKSRNILAMRIPIAQRMSLRGIDGILAVCQMSAADPTYWVTRGRNIVRALNTHHQYNAHPHNPVGHRCSTCPFSLRGSSLNPEVLRSFLQGTHPVFKLHEDTPSNKALLLIVSTIALCSLLIYCLPKDDTE